MTVYNEDQLLQSYGHGLEELFKCDNYEDYVEAITKNSKQSNRISNKT